jgi:hypothetical protein
MQPTTLHTFGFSTTQRGTALLNLTYRPNPAKPRLSVLEDRPLHTHTHIRLSRPPNTIAIVSSKAAGSGVGSSHRNRDREASHPNFWQHAWPEGHIV